MKQPEALRLADELAQAYGDQEYFKQYSVELRRLHQSEREGWRYAEELEQERKRLNEANQAMLEALAKQTAQQEPCTRVECMGSNGCIGYCWNKKPAQRKPLTDAQINAFFEGMEPNNGFWLSFARAIEAAHNIKENA